MGLFDNISKTITDVSQGAIQKGKDFADVQKYNSMISDEEKNIKGLCEQIGRRYFEEFKDSPAEQFKEYIDAINVSQGNIVNYQQKVRELKGMVTCPKCGSDVPVGVVFCAICGCNVAQHQYQAQAQPQQGQPQPQSQDTPVQEGYHCSGCGAIVPNGNKFCTSCGKSVE